MWKESNFLKELAKQFPSLHMEDGCDLYFKNSSFIIVTDRNIEDYDKIYIVPNLNIDSYYVGFSNKIIVPTDEKGKILHSLKDYKKFNHEDKNLIYEHLNKIIKRKKELDVEIKKQEIEEDFKNDSK